MVRPGKTVRSEIATAAKSGRTGGKTAAGPAATVTVRGLPARPAGLGPLVDRAVRRVMADHGIGNYVLSLTLVGDRAMASINRRALGRRGTTDVIAFDLSEPGLPAGTVGDIYVSLGCARRQSAELGVGLGEEIARLAIHGALHVVGYRDGAAAARRKMEARQEQTLRRVLARAPGRRSIGEKRFQDRNRLW